MAAKKLRGGYSLTRMHRGGRDTRPLPPQGSRVGFGALLLGHYNRDGELV